jgi:exodeoxyribonuclease V alpha subunit
MAAHSLLGDEEVRGEVAGMVYRDATSGFGVVELLPDEGDGVRATGPLADLVEGQHVRLVGRTRDHPKYGPTFEAVFYEQVAPETEAGLRAFLRSERFAEVPAAAVQRVLTTFGRQAGSVIEREPSRLVDEANLAEDVADDLHQAWIEGASLARLVALLEPAGVPMAVVRAAHAAFGSEAASVLSEDPWVLLEVERARFAHADKLARSLGGSATDPARLAAGARAAVAGARRREGHQLLPRDRAVQLAAGLLGVDPVAAVDGIERAIDSGTLAAEVAVTSRGDGTPVHVVSTPAALRAERALAEGLAGLATARGCLVELAADHTVTVADELTAGQRLAVETVVANPVTVLTGGPGTGKTRTVAEVVATAQELGADVALCAPTGRAAKRLEELVGSAATTIHRLLGARPLPGGGFVFGHDADEPLGHDLVVVDEVSMCDTALMRSLVTALVPGAHLLLVGDPDQLPSVGSGDVLADVVASRVVPVVHLDEIHRQAAGSRIVTLSREVNGGTVGPLRGVDGDVFMAEEARREAITARVVEAVAARAPAYFDVAVDDIQVVAPMYRGPCGVDALNAALKARLNPDRGQASAFRFQVGDRVMVTRNDAELDVSNGDIGTVVDVGTSSLGVQVNGRTVTFDGDSASELTLAWAITVHKSQGGQWPVVVLVADRSHRVMLRRNLVYTAVSRAAQALIVVGQSQAVAEAARRTEDRARWTALEPRLRESMLRFEADSGA